jgi:hypothetical protein
MLDQRYVLPFALLMAGCTAILLYLLAHDALGITRGSIITDAFGLAAFLAIGCIAVSFVLRKRT